MFQHHYNMGVSMLMTDCLIKEPSLNSLQKLNASIVVYNDTKIL